MSKPQLAAKNICWGVEGRKIVDDVSLCAHQNQTLGIVGPNGAGKTSLLKCLYGEYAVDGGEVLLDGISIAEMSARTVAQSIAVVSQQNPSVFDLSVIDIVKMGLVPHKSLFESDTAADAQAIEQALTELDLLPLKHRSFNSLSGGEQQRCLIARSLVQKASVLIMDEPTNHLDIYYQHQILQRINELNLTVIVSLHDLNLAAQYCDQIALIDQSKLIAVGSPEQVLTEENIRSVFKVSCVVDTHPLTGKRRISYGGEYAS